MSDCCIHITNRRFEFVYIYIYAIILFKQIIYYVLLATQRQVHRIMRHANMQSICGHADRAVFGKYLMDIYHQPHVMWCVRKQDTFQ